MQMFDVVEIKPDGFAWGNDEKTLQYWRIIRIPNMTQAHADALLAYEPGNQLINKMLRKRGNYFDLNDLPGAMQDIIFAPRMQPITATLNNNANQISALIKVKVPLQDPNG